MQIPFYRALKSIRVSDDEAATVVKELEAHMATLVTEAVKPLQTEIAGLKDKLASTNTNLTIAFALQGTLLALIGAAVAWIAAIKH